jgi:hypothetical protein
MTINEDYYVMREKLTRKAVSRPASERTTR